MTTAPAQIVSDFLRAFFSGQIERARGLTTEAFTFTAPLQAGAGSRDEYFAGARAKAALIRGVHILRQCEAAEEVATLYRLEVACPQGAASLLVSEWHRVRNERLTSACMLFDTGSDAVRLMRDALAGNHR